VLYAEWRTTKCAAKVEALEEDIVAGNFSHPIGAVGFFVAGGHSKTGVLKLLQAFERYAGTTG
jgi:hypothetical protein